VLPGCLLAGAGPGITNTPVTNTTTGSVSSAHARMISLAINIALMGFLLVQGVLPAMTGRQSAVMRR